MGTIRTKKKLIGSVTVGIFMLMLFIGSLLSIKFIDKTTRLQRYMSNLTPQKEVTVAILDTGVDITDADIDRARMSDDAYDILSDSKDITDEYGHGTTLYQLIFANTSDYVKLMPVKVADDAGIATLEDVYDGIMYAYEHGADIINLSLNTTFYSESEKLTSLIDKLSKEGIYVVVSAGNASTDAMHYFPANVDSAIVVGAMDENGKQYFYSNHGDTVDYYSYGKYGTTLGTSFASAYVTSIIADLMASGETDVKEILDLYAITNKKFSEEADNILWSASLNQGEDLEKADNTLYLSGVNTTEYNIGIRLLDLDWKDLPAEELDKYLSETDSAYVGLFLSKLSGEDLEELKEQSDVLTSDVIYTEYEYDATEKVFIAKDVTERPAYEQYLIAYEEAKDTLAVSGEWKCITNTATFYISSPSRTWTEKYEIHGLNETYLSSVMEDNLQDVYDAGRIYSTQSMYGGSYVSADEIYNPPILRKIIPFLGGARAYYMTKYVNGVQFGETEYFPDIDSDEADGALYTFLAFQFDSYQALKRGYHLSSNTVKAYNVSAGNVRTSMVDALSYRYDLGITVPQINVANFYQLVNGDIVIRYNDHTTNTDTWQSYTNIWFDNPAVDTLLISGITKTFTLNIEPLFSLGLTWRDIDTNEIASSSDVPEYVPSFEPNTYTIVYDGNGGTGYTDPQYVPFNDATHNGFFTIKDNPFTFPGCNFNNYAIVRQSDNAVYCGAYGWQSRTNAIGSNPANWFPFIPGSTWIMDANWVNPDPAVLNDTFIVCAQWQVAAGGHLLTVNPNGGTWDGSTNNQSFILNQGATKNIADPTRDGYTFTGWTLAGSGSTIANKIFTMGNANATLTANWSINRSTLKVNPNGGTWNGSTNEQTFTEDYNTTKDIPVPTRDGYRFTGWSKSSSFNGSISSLTVSATYTFGKSNGTTDTLTANWEINTSTLKVNPNGGTWNGSTNTQSFTQNYNTTKDIPVPTRTGYRFTGWTKSSSFNGSITSTTAAATYTFGKTHGATDTLTANWVINTSTLKVNPNGGTWNGSTNTQSFTQNYNTTKDIPVPTRTGYRFTGWTKSSTFYGSITSTTAAATYTFGKTHGATDTLTANWVINTSTLKVNPNGGTWNGSTDTQSFTQNYNTTKDIPVPTRTGYRFTGWTKSSTFYGSITSTTAAATYTFGKTHGATDTLTANWVINTSTLKVNPNGGTWNGSTDTQSFTQNYNTTKDIPVPTLEGYTFTGWKKSDPFNGSMTSLTAAATYTFGPTNGAEDMLTAQWRINNYNVNLIAGTGIESVTGAGTYPYKSTVNISATMLPGYHWINWTGTYNSEDIDYSFRVPAHDVTMTANGEANRYTILFDGNGATSGSMEPMSCIYDQTYTLTPNGFSKDGYHFLKWNTKADGTGDSYADRDSVKNLTTVNNGTVTLYAQWEANSYTLVFDANGGAGDIPSMQVSYDQNITLPDGAASYRKYTLDGVNVTEQVVSGAIVLDMAGNVIRQGETLPEGSSIAEDGTITYPDGTIVSPNGIITSPDGIVTYPDGNVVYPDGTTIESSEESALFEELVEESPVEENVTQTAAVTEEKKEVSMVAAPGNETAEPAQAQDAEPQPDKKAYASVFMGWSLEAVKENFIPQWVVEEMNVSTIIDAAGMTNQDGATITLYAIWDDCPWIQATNLYYTLDQAQNGFITQNEILSHATASDREDGSPILPGFHENGTSFSIPDYAPTDFTQFLHEGSCTENLTVVDSVGSVYAKQITVYIVDTTPVAVKPEGTTRFINEYYYNQPYEYGGLEDNSIWKTDPEYVAVLQAAFDNLKNDTPEQTYYFTRDVVLQMQDYVDEHGVGNTREPDALQRFYNQFCAPNLQ